VPPVDALVTEVVASLALAAHAYLEPGDGALADVRSAEIAIDVAGVAFDRIASQMKPEERSAITVLLTDVRMACVRKRGL